MADVIEFPTNLEEEFVVEVQNLVQFSNASYLDAIINFCAKRDLEVESVVPLIMKNIGIKDQLQTEAEILHLIAKTPHLPI